MARTMVTRGEEASCPVRCLLRVNVRYHLQKAGHQELACSTFARSAQEDDDVVRQYPAIVALRNIVIKLQEERRNEFVQLVLDLRAFQGTPEKSAEVFSKVASRICAKPNLGRITSLIVYAGFTAVELADRGPEFLKKALSLVEEDVDERVHAWLVQNGKSMVSLLTAPQRFDVGLVGGPFLVLLLCALVFVVTMRDAS